VENANEYRQIVKRAVEKHDEKSIERNYFLLRRGPYLIAATMRESCDENALKLKGRFIDLLDAQLPIQNEVTIPQGSQKWLLDLDRITAKAPTVLAVAGRIEKWNVSQEKLTYTISSAADVRVTTRLLLDKKPSAISINGTEAPISWDAGSTTLFVEHPSSVHGVDVEVVF
jgi:hypothetical protein